MAERLLQGSSECLAVVYESFRVPLMPVIHNHKQPVKFQDLVVVGIDRIFQHTSSQDRLSSYPLFRALNMLPFAS